MKWAGVLSDIYDGIFDGICPICGQKEARFSIHIINDDQKAGYVDIWCERCKSREQVDFRHWGQDVPMDTSFIREDVLENGVANLP